MQEKVKYEIERRFFIRMPKTSLLEEKAKLSRIQQTYLLSDDGTTARVRKREADGVITFTHTVKKRVNAARRVEEESEISAAEYEQLLLSADPACHSIEKLRYCWEYKEHCLEIDIFPFFTKKAIMEVELSDESESFEIPAELDVICEITGDRRYTNAEMAREIPAE